MITPTIQSPKSKIKKRGAPPGNTNALKHGFYSRHFKKAELASLPDPAQVSLQDEISMLRLYIRRLLDLGCDLDTLPETLDLLRVLCLATGALTRLIRTQYWLSSTNDEFGQALNQVLLDIAAEFNLSPDPPALPPPSSPHRLPP